MKLNFLGIGVQKAGTSTLHDILKRHSQIFLPEIKEAHFFDLSESYTKGMPWFLENFFSKYNDELCVGEFTPEYIYFEEAPQRIAESLGTSVRFIVVFRNPVDRALSHYNMSYRRGLEKQNFWDAIRDEQRKIIESDLARVHYSYISRGYYGAQLNRYLSLFPKENFLFLVFEQDIQKNLPKTIEKIQSFLGVPNKDLNCDIKSNEAYSPKFLMLNQLIRNKPSIGKIMDKTPLLKSLKNKAIESIVRFNRSSVNDKLFNLSLDEKQSLYGKYYKDDMQQLELLTGINFRNLWKYE
jgi:hypothetical protein